MNSLFTKTNVSCLLILLSLNVVYAGTSKVGINGSACAYESVNEAIAAASAGDTIYIRPGTYEELLGKIKVDLTLLPSESAGPGFTGCEQEMSSATSATVIVDGQTGTFDSQGGLVQISQSATVTFRHMWLRNTKADFGGVVAVLESSELILDDVLVTDGFASQAGGNIVIENGSNLQLINGSSVYRGVADFVGGAIALFDSSMTVLDGNIGVSNNNGFSQAGTDGGGIYADNSDIFLSRTQAVLQWNEAGRHGGGLYAVNSNVDISNAMITDNSADNSGGGLYLKDSGLDMFNARVNNNSSLSGTGNNGGGGIYLDDVVAEISRTRIIGNSANHMGGGVLAAENTELTLNEDSIIENNLAVISGGGISTSGLLVVDETEVISNSAQSGGGIHCEACTSIDILNNTSIRENQATNGVGGGFNSQLTSDAHISQIVDSEFLNNDSFSDQTDQGYGGAIGFTQGTLNISSTLIQGNQATYRGGAVHAEAESSAQMIININGMVFLENSTTTQQTNDGGGAMYIERADEMKIAQTRFESNNSANSGGSIFFDDTDWFEIKGSLFFENDAIGGGGFIAVFSDGVVKNSRFVNNTALNGGGAISLFLGNELSLINTVFDGNQARFGSAINLTRSELSIDSDYGSGTDQCDPALLGFNQYCSAFINNQASDLSGTITTGGDSSLDLRRTMWTGNTGLEGAVININGVFDLVTLNMENLLIHNNGLAADSASVIELTGDVEAVMHAVTVVDNQGAPLNVPDLTVDLTLTNSILFNNSDAPEVTFGASFTRSCNNSQAPSPSSQAMGGNLGDPLFETTSRGDYRLSIASPSHNACTSGPLSDLDGLFRDDETGFYDQGAFELDGLEMDPDIIFVNNFE